MKKVLFAMIVFAFVACMNNHQQQENLNKTNSHQETTQVAEKFTADMVVNTKDFSCGMPVTAGISDTCHFEGKAYGFCSPECKAEFQKDPNKFISENK